MSRHPAVESDVVVVGAGGSGLAAAVAARDLGAEVVCVEMNHDVGGHAILSAGVVTLGGGTSWQRRYGIDDSPDRVFDDFATAATLSPRFAHLRHADRELLRVWANERAPTFEFLLENGARSSFDESPVLCTRFQARRRGRWPRRRTQTIFSRQLLARVVLA